MKTTYIKQIDSLNINKCIISGLGVINNKEYDFYIDGEGNDLCLDVHKHWIRDNNKAFDGDKSRHFTNMVDVIKYLEKLFDSKGIDLDVLFFNTMILPKIKV